MLGLGFALDRQHIALDRDVDVFGSNARHRGRYDQVIAGLVHVDGEGVRAVLTPGRTQKTIGSDERVFE